MSPDEKLYRGDIPCTKCFQESGRINNWAAHLYRMEDGTYQSLCFEHFRAREKETGKKSFEDLAMIQQCFHIPWRDVVKITLHKPDPNAYNRRGKVITIEMREVPNTELMRRQAIEVAHGLQLMADRRATIHEWFNGTEQNDCWTDNNYSWEAPVTAVIRDKYWGGDRIDKFFTLCRTMAEIHEWELVDETMPLLDRIAKALDKE